MLKWENEKRKECRQIDQKISLAAFLLLMRRFDGDDAPGLRAGSVGNGDDRAVGGHAPERLQHGIFGFRIQVGRDLIQQQDARIGGCGAGDG